MVYTFCVVLDSPVIKDSQIAYDYWFPCMLDSYVKGNSKLLGIKRNWSKLNWSKVLIKTCFRRYCFKSHAVSSVYHWHLRDTKLVLPTTEIMDNHKMPVFIAIFLQGKFGEAGFAQTQVNLLWTCWCWLITIIRYSQRRVFWAEICAAVSCHHLAWPQMQYLKK